MCNIHEICQQSASLVFAGLPACYALVGIVHIIRDRTDISTLYYVNEDDNDEWECDDCERGEDRRDNNDYESDHCGYLPVQSRCSGTFMAPLLSLTVTNDLSLKHTRIDTHIRAHTSRSLTQTPFTVHSLARSHGTTFVKAISSRH